MTARRKAPSALAAALLLCAAGRARGQEPTAELPALFSRIVESVGYTTDGPVDEDEVSRLVSIKPGEPLTEEATGSTIRHLFATRRFSNVRIDATAVEAGVDVTIHLFRAFRVNPLRFDDGVSVSKEDLRRVVPLSEGAVFQADELEEGAEALKRRLDAEGYITATVQPEVFFDRKTFDAEVIYHIEAGKPARTAPPLFDGETKPFSRDELLKRTRLDPGIDTGRHERARTRSGSRTTSENRAISAAPSS